MRVIRVWRRTLDLRCFSPVEIRRTPEEANNGTSGGSIPRGESSHLMDHSVDDKTKKNPAYSILIFLTQSHCTKDNSFVALLSIRVRFPKRKQSIAFRGFQLIYASSESSCDRICANYECGRQCITLSPKRWNHFIPVRLPSSGCIQALVFILKRDTQGKSCLSQNCFNWLIKVATSTSGFFCLCDYSFAILHKKHPHCVASFAFFFITPIQAVRAQPNLCIIAKTDYFRIKASISFLDPNYKSTRMTIRSQFLWWIEFGFDKKSHELVDNTVSEGVSAGLFASFSLAWMKSPTYYHFTSSIPIWKLNYHKDCVLPESITQIPQRQRSLSFF